WSPSEARWEVNRLLEEWEVEERLSARVLGSWERGEREPRLDWYLLGAVERRHRHLVLTGPSRSPVRPPPGEDPPRRWVVHNARSSHRHRTAAGCRAHGEKRPARPSCTHR